MTVEQFNRVEFLAKLCRILSNSAKMTPNFCKVNREGWALKTLWTNHEGVGGKSIVMSQL